MTNGDRIKSARDATRARLILASCVAVFVIGATSDWVATTRRDAGPVAAVSSRDIDLYRAVVARVQSGEPYYAVMESELHERRYPTANVFNFRTPLIYFTLSWLPPLIARVLLASLGIAMLACALVVLGSRPALAMMFALVAEVGAIVSVLVPEAVLLSESWAGVLLGISVCAYHRRMWRSAAGVGIVALFVRELAAPYALLCGILALRNRRWQEVSVWVLGGVAYAVYFVWHARHVLAVQQAGGLAHEHSWLYLGGPSFVLATLRTNAWLLVAPSWCASVVLAILVAACFRPEISLHLRGVVLLYLSFFLVIGQPFNFYWGLLSAPAWGLAIADGVEAVPEFIARAKRRPV